MLWPYGPVGSLKVRDSEAVLLHILAVEDEITIRGFYFQRIGYVPVAKGLAVDDRSRSTCDIDCCDVLSLYA